ncbi:potassium channel family protein [uncultured Oxalicibacterium sp.]|uniref:potassium channel family protein n=1 Tax=uncultured Oxalicibacterium sp. TaxID=1168540 RepID=UPI0025F4D85E|nr:potassium channel family protein [uncultured Oxalicibacterium sp.]
MSTVHGKKVGHLKDLLNSQTFDEETLRRLIDGKSEINNGPVTFKILRDVDLKLDEEHRFYEDSFVFHQTIFDCKHIDLRNSSKIKLIDCLVIGTLSVLGHPSENTEVSLDVVAITEKLSISGRNDPMSVYLNSVQARELCLYNFTTSDLNVTDSRFALTAVSHLIGDSLTMTGNELGTLSISDCEFHKVRFPAGQVQLDHLNTSQQRAFLRRSPFTPLKFVVGIEAIDQALDVAVESERKRQQIETLNFLVDRSDIPHSKRDAAQLKYLRSLAESPSWFSRVFVIATGGFIKPSRIVLWAAVVILGFSGIYWQGASSFGQANPIGSYWDALYFSGVTFTTIGYGDILPLHWMRVFAVFEGLLGISLSGAFLVSLTRRYIE